VAASDEDRSVKLGRDGVDLLLTELRRRGYDLVGPVQRDGAVVLDRIAGAGDLAAGVVDEQGPGSYRLGEGDAGRVFTAGCGPTSAKRFLFPAHESVATVRRVDGRLTVEEAPVDARPLAIIGLRSCDLGAVAVQDRVFLGRHPDPRYQARREATFLVGVDCSRAGGTCFCASMGTGPACDDGFDVALTELASGEFLIRAGTPRGEDVVNALPVVGATDAELAEAADTEARVVAEMRRAVETVGLRDLLFRNLEHPRWEAVGERCLACGNCTAACPTCFCTDMTDVAGIDGETAEQGREWGGCFSLEYSHLAGHDVRVGRDARYRQWLTHKFAGWFDQFGTSGCVGCGRCITWCPVGIDVTEELAAIRAGDGEVRQ